MGSPRYRSLLRCLTGAAAWLLLPSCNGLFEGLYDAPQPASEYGFVSVDEQRHTGRIFVDATSYTEWHYIDLHDKQLTTTAVGEAAPERWDFAIHRYDAKSHGGAAAECTAVDFGSLPAAGSLPADSFVTDEWTIDRITVDMSQMMEGVIRYAEDWYNPLLSQWLHVDTSTMPPIYTLSGKIYLLRLADGTCAALRLTNFMNDSAVKGFMTIDYSYPIQP